MKNRLLPTFVCTAAACVSAQAATLVSNTFSTASTEGWAAVNGTGMTSNIADANFPATSPVLQLTNTGGNVVRGTLSFATTTLGQTGDFIQVEFDLRIAGSANGVDRRFETTLWDSATQDGYGGRIRVGTTAAANNFFESSTVPSTGVASTGSTALTTSGATTNSIGISQTYIHHMTLTITRTDTGVDLSYTGIEDNGTARTITASDATSPFYTFNTLDVNTWGNSLNFNIDNVIVTTNVPEPAVPSLLGGLALLSFFRRRR